MLNRLSILKTGSYHPNYRFRYVFFFVIACTIFVGTSIWHAFGWRTGSPSAASYQQLLPQFYFVLLLVGISNKENILKTRLEEVQILLTIAALIFTMVLIGNTGSLSGIPNGLMLPALISLIIRGMPIQTVRKIRPWVIGFVIFNSLFAVAERLLFVNFFPFTGSETGGGVIDGTFRSSALQNHPLNNALMTSTIMSFLLWDKSLPLLKKYGAICLGFVSLLCFNTRSSIVLWGAILGVHFIGVLLSNKKRVKKAKPVLILGMAVAVTALMYLLFVAGWGNRLLEIDLSDDSSAAARLEVWAIFDYYSLNDFLFGTSADSFGRVLDRIGMARVENYWLIFIVRYGVIFTALLTFMYVRLFRRLFSGYKTIQVLFITGVFLLLSSTNNSLAFSEQPLSVFIICCYVFSPKLFPSKTKKVRREERN